MLAAIAAAVLLHLLFGWGLTGALARKLAGPSAAPIEVRIVDEPRPLPPPPPPPALPTPPPARMPVQRAAPAPSPAPAAAALPAPVREAAVAPAAVAAVAPMAATGTLPAAGEPSADTAPASASTLDLPGAATAAAPAGRAATPARIDFSTCVKPDYPVSARRAQAEGVTRIRFAIDASGQVTRADVEQPSGPTREHRQLDRSAVQALSGCRFQPGADSEGRPVGAYARVDYVWRLVE